MKFFPLDIKLPEKKTVMNIKATPSTKLKVKSVQKQYKENNIELDQDKILEAGCLWLEENLKRGLKA